MDAQLNDHILAESGVRELQGRYIDAVWRKDFTAFADCFTSDAEWRIGGLVLKGPAQCVEILQNFIVHYDRVRMVMQPALVEASGDTAIARTDVIEHNILKVGGRHLAIGTYYDRIVRQGDRWRYVWHYYQIYYLGAPDMSGQFYEVKDFGAPFAMPDLDEPTTAVTQ